MKRLLILSFLFVSLLVQAKDKVYVACFSTIGLENYSGIGSSVLLADKINDYGKYEAILPQYVDSTTHVENLSEARESAEVLSAAYYIMGRIVKIEREYHVTVNMYAMSSTMSLWSYNQTTGNASDIATILDYAAAHLGQVRKWSMPGDVYRETKGEAKPATRLKPNLSLGASVGGLIPLSEKDERTGHYRMAPGYGFMLMADARDFIFVAKYNYYHLDLTANGILINGTEYEEDYHSFGVDVFYPIYTTNNAPYASLGASYVEKIFSFTPKSLGAKNSGMTNYRHDNYLMIDGGIGYFLRRNSRAGLCLSAKGYLLLNSAWGYEYGATMGVAMILGRPR